VYRPYKNFKKYQPGPFKIPPSTLTKKPVGSKPSETKRVFVGTAGIYALEAVAVAVAVVVTIVAVSVDVNTSSEAIE
jgi:hypothetical protein